MWYVVLKSCHKQEQADHNWIYSAAIDIHVQVTDEIVTCDYMKIGCILVDVQYSFSVKIKYYGKVKKVKFPVNSMYMNNLCRLIAFYICLSNK